ncbi:MAG: hypothetical protein Q9209_006717 [Squamulea sp. 1 TL-2023]
MPTYHTGCLNIKLAVADLNKTVTPNPITHQGRESLANTERALKEFTEYGTTIAETPLVDADGYSLSYLGRGKDIPFLMAHAHPTYAFNTLSASTPLPKTALPPSHAIPQEGDSQDSPLTELSSPRSSVFRDLDDTYLSSRLSRSLKPAISIDHDTYKDTVTQALCLRIQPTKKSFLCVGEPRKMKWGHSDMKIDVFLNGDLCTSAYIAESAFYKRVPLRDTFSGARVGWVTEKPWILVPPAPGDTYVDTNVKGRWNAIARALGFVASLQGRNERNELSPSTDYLQSLASLPMPATLPKMLGTVNKRFAIIDVIVTTGKGRKEDASAPYLMRPMPLKLAGFEAVSPAKAIRHIDSPQPRKRVRTAHPTRSYADAEILSQQFPLQYVRRGSASRATHAPGNADIDVLIADPLAGHPSNSKLTVPGHSIIEAITTASKTPTVPTPLPSQSNRAYRNRMRYHDVVDTRQTWEEELKGIVDQAANDTGFVTKRLVTRSKAADPLDVDDLAVHTSIAPTTAGLTSEGTHSPSKMVTLKYGSSVRQPASDVVATSKRKLVDDEPSSPEQPLVQLRSSLKLDIPSTPRLPAPITSTKGGSKSAVRSKKYQQAVPFEIPALSRDSVVTYAPGETVRQVRSERGGWFREEAVLVGMRFVVG